MFNCLTHNFLACTYESSESIWVIPNFERSIHKRNKDGTARKTFWNRAGVETVYWKPADIDPGLLIVVRIENVF